MYDALIIGWKLMVAYFRAGLIGLFSFICVVIWGSILVVGTIVIFSGLVVTYPLVVVLNRITDSTYNLSIRAWKKSFDNSAGADPIYD